MLRLKLSGKKKHNRQQNCTNVLNDKMQKLILEYIKTNNSGEADKPRGSLSRENKPDTYLRKTCFQSTPKYCACCAKARRECLTWERCLTVFRIISEPGPEISNRRIRRQCQLQGNTKETY